MKRYNPSEIESKWQQIWEVQKANQVIVDESRSKYYVSGMFPYPSGAGMHVGHAYSYSIVDTVARFYRLLGYNVLNPIGWDTFGLPAENYAIKTGTAPAVITLENIANFKKQFKRMGVSIDWSRELSTSDPEYYRWTQWVFTKLFERGLAYQKESLQWWCPVDKTVLANEQVEGGKCWRCGSEVEKKSMKQWFFKITEYADELLEELPDLDWPNKIKVAQTNWIGRSVGAEVEFKLENSDEAVTVFTTRPDTLFGATFVVIAPEHPLAKKLSIGDFKEFSEKYIADSIKKSEIERMNDTREKTGVFTGSYAINPVNGEKVPIWIADYVLIGYGTGAIMAVPAHDERDFAFATKYDLPIIEVVEPETGKKQDNPEFRKSIVAILRDPKTNKFLSINWGKDFGGNLFVGGGREDGEEAIDAAKREITEETGYKNISFVSMTGKLHHNYFAYSKGVARNIEAYSLLFDLINDEKESQSLQDDEKGKFEIEWLSEVDVEAKVVDELHATSYQLLTKSPCYHNEGILVNSGNFDGISSSDAREEIVAWLEKQGTGRAKTSYKMRDWLISRQRYWGAPTPIIHCDDCGAVAVPEDQLPVLLPEIADFAPKGDGKSALASVTDWVNTTCPKCGGPAKRETDTMDGYACSSWYLLRYTDPNNNKQAWDPKLVNYWAPIDCYIGGDHAVAHLLYVRFWTHVFHDMGLTNFKEPVKKLVYHGYINAEDGSKMSKSKGNVVDPLDVIDQGYGADALRTYVLFMSPVELDASWSSGGVAGIYRFLNRIWTLVQEYLEAEKNFIGNDEKIVRFQHKMVQKVTEDIYRMSLNTAISAMMEYTNDLYKLKVDGFSDQVWLEALSTLIKTISPFAPHIAEELWQQLGHDDLIQHSEWPKYDEKQIINEHVTIVVQVNGKLRGKFEIAADANEQDVIKQAMQNSNVKNFVGDKKPLKTIYISGKLINIVINS